MSTAIGVMHERWVFERRTKALCRHLAALIPAGASVLDVGCGDGTIDTLLERERPDLSLRGVDVLVRPTAKIPVQAFDGHRLPQGDRSVDVVMFVDVLHHTTDPTELLREAQRVARHYVLIKDHTLNGALAYSTLRLMDWVGNAHHGVVLPYNYWTERQWRTTFAALGLTIQDWRATLGLYPWPMAALFERRLHFIARLRRVADW